MAKVMNRNLVGVNFGLWTVIEKADPASNGRAQWLCKCTCGKEKIVRQAHLIKGQSNSCSAGGKHGIGKSTPGHQSYLSMMARCNDVKHKAYPRYGGAGIAVCERWNGNFANFLADMGERPEGLSLDRIDNKKGYEPENCRWATNQEQQNNTKRNRYINHKGVRMTIAEAARAEGVIYMTFYIRLRRAGLLS